MGPFCFFSGGNIREKRQTNEKQYEPVYECERGGKVSFGDFGDIGFDDLGNVLGDLGNLDVLGSKLGDLVNKGDPVVAICPNGEKVRLW